jgi:hypothetical protein
MIIDEQHRRKITNQRSETPEIEQIVAQRERLLKQDPRLREFQKEIDALLGATLDPALRLEILGMLMSERLNALHAAWADVAHAMHLITPAACNNPQTSS